MKHRWDIPDFLDLEYFFLKDRKLAEMEGENALRDRDRSLYLEEIEPTLVAGSKPNRKWLIHRWLQVRRRRENQDQEGQALLPGKMWQELYGLSGLIFSFFALTSGTGLAYSFLAYSGKQPVNVSSFFLFFVCTQTLILFLMPAAWIYRKTCGLDLRSSLLPALVNTALTGMFFKIGKYSLKSMQPERKEQLTAAFAIVRTRGKGYGSIFIWPLFLLFQLFGIVFNLGVLGSVLLKVTGTDLAFGWQSTIQLSSQFVFNLVQWIATPWSWLLPASISYPDPAQIEGSRMILKEGIYRLASDDLTSWWPFLCLSVFSYCLLPRILLFVTGTVARKRYLARISLSRADHNQLIHHLLTPRLETGIRDREQNLSPVDNKDVVQNNSAVVAKKETVQPPKNENAVNGILTALIPDELFDDCELQELGHYCRQVFGYQVINKIKINEQHGDNLTLFRQLCKTSGPGCPPLLILQEAWQPPIQETFRFLDELRATCGHECHIIIALIGKPNPETLFTPASSHDLQIWQLKTAALGDPNLQINSLVDHS
ncbi:MAG: DUF2868 domain-containing protein [Desulfobulbaceae bacterium]|nr:DUF2868 domain-containing protein [Desulfobulbaceae bacterium]